MNGFLQFAAQCRPRIATRIQEILTDFQERSADYGGWAIDLFERLARYTVGGKMMRGALVLLAHRGYGGTLEAPILSVAAGMELLQSFLLIHDDIIDQDALRRGQESMHVQYARQGDAESAAAGHYGNSMAICCGDVAFALANICMEYGVRDAHLPPAVAERARELYNTEIVRVGIAQMDDVSFSATRAEPSAQDILRLYRHKTGYYSMVLPLTLGALLANQQSELPLLERIGTALGEVFQIRDDLLGLGQGSEEGGKSIASDIINKKKTYIRQLVIGTQNRTHQRQLHELESSAALPEQELLSRYRRLLEEAGILQKIAAQLSRTNKTILADIDTLSHWQAEQKDILRQLCKYNSQR